MKTVSVIIPTYNRYSMLCEAIESVMAQKDVQVEIIVVDDNSSDETSNINSVFSNITYIKSVPNVGPGLNRRRGFNSSNGDYVVFLDDDDFYVDDLFFKKAVDILEKYMGVAFVSGNSNKYEMPDGLSTPITMPIEGYVDGKYYLNNFMVKLPKPSSTFPTVFRKSSLLKAGVDTMVEVNDASIYLRALTQGDVFFIKDIVGNYRFHKCNITKSLDPCLIIRNMAEKNYILQVAKDKLYDSQLWYLGQMMITYGYYLECNPPKIDQYKVLLWLVTHGHGYPKIYSYVLKMLF